MVRDRPQRVGGEAFAPVHDPSLLDPALLQNVDGRLQSRLGVTHRLLDVLDLVLALDQALFEEWILERLHGDASPAQAVGDSRREVLRDDHIADADIAQHRGDHVDRFGPLTPALRGPLRVLAQREHLVCVGLAPGPVDLEVAHHIDAAAARRANEDERIRTEEAGRVQDVGVGLAARVEQHVLVLDFVHGGFRVDFTRGIGPRFRRVVPP